MNTPFLNTQALHVCVCKAYVPRGLHFISPLLLLASSPPLLSLEYIFMCVSVFIYFCMYVSICPIYKYIYHTIYLSIDRDRR